MKCTLILVLTSYALVSCSLAEAGDSGASGYALLSASRGIDPGRRSFRLQQSRYQDDNSNIHYESTDLWNGGGNGSGSKPYYPGSGGPSRRSYLVNRPYASGQDGLGGSLFIPRTLAMNRYGRSFFAMDPSRRGIIDSWKSWRSSGGPLEEFGANYFEQHPSRSRFLNRVEELRNNGLNWPFSDGAFGLPYLDRSAYSGPGRGLYDPRYGGFSNWGYNQNPNPIEPPKPDGHMDALIPIRPVQPVHPPNFENAPIVIPIPQRSGTPPRFVTRINRVRTRGTPSEVEVIRPIFRVETPSHPDKQSWMDFTTDAERFRIVNEGDYASKQQIVGPMGRNKRSTPIRPGTWNPTTWPIPVQRYQGQPNWNHFYGASRSVRPVYRGSLGSSQRYGASRYIDPRVRYMGFSPATSSNNAGIDTNVLSSKLRSPGSSALSFPPMASRAIASGSLAPQRFGVVNNVGASGARPIPNPRFARSYLPGRGWSQAAGYNTYSGGQSTPYRVSSGLAGPTLGSTGKQLVLDDGDE